MLKKKQKTIEAMQAGIDVIAQGRLELGTFGGYSDFLLKVTKGEAPFSQLGHYHYEVWDSKLTSKVKPIFFNTVMLLCRNT